MIKYFRTIIIEIYEREIMSRFKKAIKKKKLVSALSKHPLRELGERVKSDYVEGLVFLATEDESFHEEEKSYILSLMKNLGLDEALLDEFTSFASDCEEEELLSFMDRIKEFDKDIKLNFLIEVIVLAFKDGEFDESEQSMLDDYLEMLELTEQKDDIMYMALALVNKDIDLALSLYTAKKEFFNKFDYMFDMIEIDIEKELKELYNWKWLEFRLEEGKVENDNFVASKPVTVRQMSVYLNSQLISHELYQVPNTTKFENKSSNELIINSIDKINLDYEDGLFSYNEEIQNNDFVGTEEKTPSCFSDWINKLDIRIKINELKIITSYSFTLEESSCGFLTNNKEHLIVHIEYENQGDKATFIDPSTIDHSDIKSYQIIPYSSRLDESYAFRLMKKEEK